MDSVIQCNNGLTSYVRAVTLPGDSSGSIDANVRQEPAGSGCWPRVPVLPLRFRQNRNRCHAGFEPVMPLQRLRHNLLRLRLKSSLDARLQILHQLTRLVNFDKILKARLSRKQGVYVQKALGPVYFPFPNPQALDPAVPTAGLNAPCS